MDTKEKIVEALEKNPINTIEQAIIYLEDNDNFYIKEVTHKWEATSEDDNEFRACFFSDEEVIEWAREEREGVE